MLYFVPPDGRNVPLFRLASDCGYRIDTICERLDVSPRHFRRLFQSLLGISPKSWLKAERMVFARNLLRGGHSIKQVSEKLGYSAQKEFYREFMQYYKVAPSEFRSRESERAMSQLGWAV
ncbi:MAG: helix-turn-helix transcriptional regulator [Luteolibacter sp.]